jgi:hypothetical protein
VATAEKARTPATALVDLFFRSLHGFGAEDEQLAPALALIPDVARWSAPERRALAQLIRARGGPERPTNVRRAQRHSRLRETLLRLGGPEP